MEINKVQTLEICKVAWRAGEIILDIYSKKFKIFRKKDLSPVTIADLESEKTIIKGLKKIFSKPTIFSEETNYKSKNKLNNFWLVDPLDGTKEFIKRNGEFTMIISRSHSTKNENEELKKKYNIKKVLFLGSSLKFCYIAEGIAHIYPRNGTTYEWDTAAGHAIINGVGGKIETDKGTELKYGKKDFKNTNFIAKIF